MSDADLLLHVYATASGGNQEAYAWLLAWHGWCHEIDDHVDENRPAREVVDLCAKAGVLFSAGFYRRHADALGPIVGVIAAKYRASLDHRGTMADVLRVAGNDMVLAVAYLTGGTVLVDAVSRKLWPIVQKSQLDHDPIRS